MNDIRGQKVRLKKKSYVNSFGETRNEYYLQFKVCGIWFNCLSSNIPIILGGDCYFINGGSLSLYDDSVKRILKKIEEHNLRIDDFRKGKHKLRHIKTEIL